MQKENTKQSKQTNTHKQCCLEPKWPIEIISQDDFWKWMRRQILSFAQWFSAFQSFTFHNTTWWKNSLKDFFFFLFFFFFSQRKNKTHSYQTVHCLAHSRTQTGVAELTLHIVRLRDLSICTPSPSELQEGCCKCSCSSTRQNGVTSQSPCLLHSTLNQMGL